MATGRFHRVLLVAAALAWCAIVLTGLLGFGHSGPDVVPRVDFFIRSMDKIVGEDTRLGPSPADLDGALHYRLVPGLFPKGMGFHFDGLATVLKFTFQDGHVSYRAKPYESQAVKDFDSCIFIGTGTGPTLGRMPCLENPSVNLLPIRGQLWLTIDTALWGRVDPATLDTLPNKVSVPSQVLNAHPACDPRSGDCFVQYNCGAMMVPLTDQSCIGVLQSQDGNLEVQEVSRAQLPRKKLIQHSHSPCLTPNYLVSKLDAFTSRSPLNENSGMLKFVHQDEDNLWMVMDRRTNVSRIMASANFSFVNNHFWNCYEDEAGEVVVDTVATTKDYLDGYFARNLEAKPAAWDTLFKPALRCRVPPTGEAIACEPLFRGRGSAPAFDYPTFNPAYKMRQDYRYFYAIAAASRSSLWFDELIKVDATQREIIKTWSADGIFLTEADYMSRQSGEGDSVEREDDGYLLSVMYNSSSDESSLAIFSARDLELRHQYPLGTVVPFHAHGIVCEEGGARCLPNP